MEIDPYRKWAVAAENVEDMIAREVERKWGEKKI